MSGCLVTSITACCTVGMYKTVAKCVYVCGRGGGEKKQKKQQGGREGGQKLPTFATNIYLQLEEVLKAERLEEWRQIRERPQRCILFGQQSLKTDTSSKQTNIEFLPGSRIKNSRRPGFETTLRNATATWPLWGRKDENEQR